MTWREELRPASFRGVPFYVDTADTEGGHRQVVHKYPKRNKVYVEDLGLEPDVFSVRAYLIGDDYISRRDALIQEMKRPGEGTLVLPTMGSRKVKPQTFRIGYDRREGGVEYLDLTFVEPGENAFPSQSLDTAAKVGEAAEAAKQAAKADFDQQFTVQGHQDYVANAASQQAGLLAQALTSAGNLRAGEPEAAAAFAENLEIFTARISSLILNPSSFSASVLALISQMGSVFPAPSAAFSALIQIARFGSSFLTLPRKTRSQQQQAVNQDALVSLVRRTALIEQARVATEIQFPSYDDAVELRDSLAGRIDEEILRVGTTDEDEIYLTLENVRAAMIEDVTRRAANLERIRTVSFQQTLPSLVLSYEIYETTDRSDEIVQRNRIAHPGFIPAGQPIQILV